MTATVSVAASVTVTVLDDYRYNRKLYKGCNECGVQMTRLHCVYGNVAYFVDVSRRLSAEINRKPESERRHGCVKQTSSNDCKKIQSPLRIVHVRGSTDSNAAESAQIMFKDSERNNDSSVEINNHQKLTNSNDDRCFTPDEANLRVTSDSGEIVHGNSQTVGKKSYQCRECKQQFNYHHSLKLHLLKHNGQRPHICQQCNKSYLTISHLNFFGTP